MKQIDFSKTGGQGFFVDDFEFLQNSIIETFQNILSTFDGPSPNYLILSGCEVVVNTNDFTISAGVIGINREVFAVPAVVLTKDGAKVPIFAINESFDPILDPSPFENGVPQNIHKIRIANAILDVAITGSMVVQGAPAIGGRIALLPGMEYKANVAEENWIYYPTSGPSANQIQYRKDAHGWVHFLGCLFGSGGFGYFTIPDASCWPKTTQTLNAGYFRASPTAAFSYIIVTISTAGVVTPSTLPPGSNDVVLLQGLSFPTN